MDQKKETILPLLYIDFLYQETNEQAIYLQQYYYTQQRDTQPVVTDNRLLKDTNFLDNMNET
jgi:hypothetical protein